MSGPLGAGGVEVLLVDGVVGVSCCATARSASACPSSPSGLFARNPAMGMGSEVTFGTGGAGCFVRVLVCGTRVCWSKCLHSPGR